MFLAPVQPDPHNTVWVIDDSAACRRLICALVVRAGASAREFASAEDALDAIATRDWPCAILTDLEMPGRQGIELVVLLRTAGFSGAIAVMSATSDDSVRHAAKAAGAVAMLAKDSMVQSVPCFVHAAVRGELRASHDPLRDAS